MRTKSYLLWWCHGGVTVVSRWCHGGVTVVSRWCHDGVTVVSRWCHGGVTVVSRWCHGGVTVVSLVVSRWCHLDEEGHVGQSDPTTFGRGPELSSQGHQAAQVHLVTVTEVRDLQRRRHRLHHRSVETWRTRVGPHHRCVQTPGLVSEGTRVYRDWRPHQRQPCPHLTGLTRDTDL